MDIRTVRLQLLGAGMLLCGVCACAQTLATGDARTVTEPVFPTSICAQIAAETTITNAVTGTVASETNDTQIQGKLNTCGTGNALELTLNSNGNNAFVIAPITIPGGVTLIVDGGVTVFGSRSATDYGSTCGISSGGGSGCKPLIMIGAGSSGTHSTNVALMGYGIIDGRGEATMTSGTNSGESWWANGTAGNGSQNNPVLVSSTYSDSFTMYKITLRNSPLFHVTYKYGTGFTAWGIKISTPYTTANTDGVDPDQATNVTVNNSYISDGDDDVAVGGTSSSPSSNVTFENSHVASGHGASISDDGGNVSNVLVNNVTFSGQTVGSSVDGNSEAIHLKGNPAEGGSTSPTFSNITYENLCIENIKHPLRIDPFYDNSSGATPATFTNIVVQNVTVLTEGQIGLQGYSANNLTTLTLNNFFYNAYQSKDITPAPQDITINLGGNVYPGALQTLTGTGVSYNGSATENATPSESCPSTSFPTLNGELYATTSTNTVGVPYTLATTDAGTYTLNAMVQPVYSEASYAAYTGAAVPSASVQFYDSFNGGTATAVGSPVALGQNGTLASLAVSNPAVGTHAYTAQYLGDSNYGAITFAGLTVTVSAGPAAKLGFNAAPATPITYGNGPGTVTVAVEDASGDTVSSSTASVTLTVTATGYSKAYTVSAVNGVATFSAISIPPGVGTYTYTATGGSLTSAAAGESVNAATLTATANAVSRLFDVANPALTYTIAGYVNGDGSGVVSGAPVLSTSALRNSPVVVGGYPINISAGTLSAANYSFTAVANTLTVNGSVPQSILFAPLPNLTHGGSYQLTAMSTSGLPVTYSVSGAGASVSGATLTLSAATTGTVTVTAQQAGNASYAAAANVAQSFVVQ